MKWNTRIYIRRVHCEGCHRDHENIVRVTAPEFLLRLTDWAAKRNGWKEA